jgi:hypothetical protein
MEGKHFVIIGIAGLLAWSSHSIINGYIASQTEQKKIESQISLSKEETRRLEIMKEASREVPYVGTNVVMTEEMINKIFKGALTAKSITIGGKTMETTKTDYQKQANDFMEKVGANMEVKLLGNCPYFDDDKEPRDVYQITLKRGGKKYSFRFGQSIADSEKHIKPTAYDVLANVQKSEIGTFEDFCSEFDYDEDSQKAEKIYFSVQKEYAGIHKIFGDVIEELIEELEEIN